jgi:hypothetical protein
MKLNGWQRLWVVAILFWALGLMAFTGVLFLDIGTADWDIVRTAALVWVVSSIALYGIGYAVAWAIRGFKSTATQ